MKRQIIIIDEDKCTGCGDCIPECHEGALQIIDGKCRLISDLFCDGLGACVGSCPEDAMWLEEKEAEPYNEKKVVEEMIGKPHSVIKAHLKHLLEHGEIDFYDQAVEILNQRGIPNPFPKSMLTMNKKTESGKLNLNILSNKPSTAEINSGGNLALSQWPVMLHLVNPDAQFFKKRELLIMSSCGPVAYGKFHKNYLSGRSMVLACPKLDYTEPYTQKLAMIYNASGTPKAIVVRMEVPCCSGLTKFAVNALNISGRNDLEIEEHIIGIDGLLKKINVLTN